MNKVILCGRLTRDPEVRYSQGDKPFAVAKYTLAVDRKFKQEGSPTADFINCVAMGKNGEFAEKYLHKGTKIIVTGRWQTGSYTNKDGQTVYTNDCMVEEHEFCESRNASQQASGNDSPKPMQTNGSKKWLNIPDGIDNELPFD